MLYRMFGYLKLHPKRKLAFDPVHPIVSEKRFKECNWNVFIATQRKQFLGTCLRPEETPCRLIALSTLVMGVIQLRADCRQVS
jgi:dihydropteroate synthase